LAFAGFDIFVELEQIEKKPPLFLLYNRIVMVKVKRDGPFVGICAMDKEASQGHGSNGTNLYQLSASSTSPSLWWVKQISAECAARTEQWKSFPKLSFLAIIKP